MASEAKVGSYSLSLGVVTLLAMSLFLRGLHFKCLQYINNSINVKTTIIDILHYFGQNKWWSKWEENHIKKSFFISIHILFMNDLWWWANMFWNVDLNSMSCSRTLWWRHQMDTFAALLAIHAGNSPVTGEFPAQRPVTRSCDVFFDLRLNKRLSKQPWGWWFETPSCSLWRHCDERWKLFSIAI